MTTVDLPNLTKLPQIYDREFTRFTEAWSADRRRMGRHVLLWLFNNPAPTDRPVRPGYEFELRLIDHDEYDRMHAAVMKANADNVAVSHQMAPTVAAVKQFHLSAHRLLSPQMAARLTLLAHPEAA